MTIKARTARLHRKVARATRMHRKVLRAMHSHRVHRHVFHYAVATHFIHVAMSAGTVRSIEAAIAFAASLGTLLMHITEEEKEHNQSGAGDYPGPQGLNFNPWFATMAA